MDSMGSGGDSSPPTPDSLVQPEGNESSDDNDLFGVLFVVLVVVALALVFGYIMYA